MIDKQYFRSWQFVAALVVAVTIIAAGAGAYSLAGSPSRFFSHDACRTPALAGTLIPLVPMVITEDGGERRSETYTLDASAFEGGAIDLCVEVGEIMVGSTTSRDLTVAFVIKGDHRDAVADTTVETRVMNDQGRLVLAAWESNVGASGSIFGSRSAEVIMTITLPETGAYALRALDNVGNIHLSALRASSLSLGTSVGDIIATEIDLEGNATAISDVGNVILAFSSVQSGLIKVQSDVGDAEMELPLRADVGYDATVGTDVGSLTVNIGPEENRTSNEDVTGGRITVRSADYQEKPTHVVVKATSNVGDARIAAK